MKMKKLLSVSALALTITTCTSVSAFAAEYAGNTNRNQAVKQIAMKAYTGGQVVNKLNITVKTPVKTYAKEALINRVIDCINEGIKDKDLNAKVTNTIKNGYNSGDSFIEIFNSIVSINNENGVDITTDTTFNAAKSAMEQILKEFNVEYHDGNLDDTINKYFKINKTTGTLTYGINSNNRLVVTLEKSGQVVLQVNSENVDALEKEIRENIHSWADLKTYFNKIK